MHFNTSFTKKPPHASTPQEPPQHCLRLSVYLFNSVKTNIQCFIETVLRSLPTSALRLLASNNTVDIHICTRMYRRMPEADGLTELLDRKSC